MEREGVGGAEDDADGTRADGGGTGRGRRALVVLATYNERENLPIVLERIWAVIDIDVLVVDDNSPDGTGRVADRIAATEPRLAVIHRAGKAGLASALFAATRTPSRAATSWPSRWTLTSRTRLRTCPTWSPRATALTSPSARGWCRAAVSWAARPGASR